MHKLISNPPIKQSILQVQGKHVLLFFEIQMVDKRVNGIYISCNNVGIKHTKKYQQNYITIDFTVMWKYKRESQLLREKDAFSFTHTHTKCTKSGEFLCQMKSAKKHIINNLE